MNENAPDITLWCLHVGLSARCIPGPLLTEAGLTTPAQLESHFGAPGYWLRLWLTGPPTAGDGAQIVGRMADQVPPDAARFLTLIARWERQEAGQDPEPLTVSLEAWKALRFQIAATLDACLQDILILPSAPSAPTPKAIASTATTQPFRN